MNKLASVVFAYSPKNDDELELKVGDKIEVIGFEEEGKFLLEIFVSSSTSARIPLLTIQVEFTLCN